MNLSSAPPLGTLPDGTRYYAPLGSLPLDEPTGMVQCHACGRWFRQLHHAHLGKHGLTVAEYRELFGLRGGHPLQAPDLVALRRSTMRRQLETDPRVRSALEQAQRRARAGAMVDPARAVNRGQARRLETKERIRATLLARAPERSRVAHHRREERAKALGFDSLEQLLRQRYERDGWGIDRLARALGCRAEAVRAELDAAGIARTDAALRMSSGSRAWSARQEAERRRRVSQLGFASLDAYAAARIREGWTRKQMAAELGISPDTLRRHLARPSGGAG